MKSLTKLAGLVVALLGLPIAATAGQHYHDGDGAPALNANIVAGAHAGETYCITCKARSRPVAITFIDSAADIDKVGRYAKRLDRLARRHRDEHLRAVLVFVGDAAMDEGTLRDIAESRRLRRVSLATLADSGELSDWGLDASKPTNAYLVNNGQIARHLSARCPTCDRLPVRMSDTLWTTLASSRDRGGYLAY